MEQVPTLKKRLVPSKCYVNSVNSSILQLQLNTETKACVLYRKTELSEQISRYISKEIVTNHVHGFITSHAMNIAIDRKACKAVKI